MRFFMKKCIILLLVAALIICSSSIAFADTTSTEYDLEPVIIDGATIFVRVVGNDTYVCVIDESDSTVHLSQKNSGAPNTVQQFIIDASNIAGEINLNTILFYVNENKIIPETVYFTDSDELDDSNLANARSATGFAFNEQMTDLVGEPFTNRLKTTRYEHGLTFRVYETMQFRILANGSKSWSGTITVASLITAILGEITTSGLVNAICFAYGVSSSIYTLLSPGSIDKYTCRAQYFHYVTINNYDYAYNITFKYIDYKGYDDGDPNSPQPAQIDTDSRDLYYGNDETYYYSYSSQITDAYNMYLRIGAQ